MRWGIAATGRIARAVGAVVVEHPDMRVAAVGSRDADRAAQLAAELGAQRSYGSYEQLVRDDEVDAVYVATPHPQHADVARAALAAGKAVLCEKPLTDSLAETERLVAAAREANAFLMEAMWTRFNPLVRQLRASVAGGELGEVRSVEASLGFASAYDPAHRLWARELGGGAVLDLAVYTVDFARSLLGEPSDVVTTGSLAPNGADAESSLLLTFDSGAIALLAQSLVTNMPTTATVIGSRGWAQLAAPFHSPTRLVVQRGGNEPEEHTIPDARAGFVGELEEVARCVRKGRTESDVMPLAETVGTARVLDAALRALAVG